MAPDYTAIQIDLLLVSVCARLSRFMSKLIDEAQVRLWRSIACTLSYKLSHYLWYFAATFVEPPSFHCLRIAQLLNLQLETGSICLSALSNTLICLEHGRCYIFW